jgi:hypothetical protein
LWQQFLLPRFTNDEVASYEEKHLNEDQKARDNQRNSKPNNCRWKDFFLQNYHFGIWDEKINTGDLATYQVPLTERLARLLT